MGTIIFRCQFFAVLSFKTCITDKQFSSPVIETGKVKAGCQMSYRREKYQNPGGGGHVHINLYQGIIFRHKFLN